MACTPSPGERCVLVTAAVVASFFYLASLSTPVSAQGKNRFDHDFGVLQSSKGQLPPDADGTWSWMRSLTVIVSVLSMSSESSEDLCGSLCRSMIN